MQKFVKPKRRKYFHNFYLALPSGSTLCANWSASDVARSVLAGVTARMRQVSLQMNCMSMSRIWLSMSTGWSPTAILVRPGRSIKVMFSTAGRSRHNGVQSWRSRLVSRQKKQKREKGQEGQDRILSAELNQIVLDFVVLFHHQVTCENFATLFTLGICHLCQH